MTARVREKAAVIGAPRGMNLGVSDGSPHSPVRGRDHDVGVGVTDGVGVTEGEGVELVAGGRFCTVTW
ncbi:hypothetical protein GCM10025780_14710 [Frondihabitans cladoniiphilus]|uniref:Uncharacterized protein n=1 Tax=Frondihabitans cladoniiphilus TaxID=715785 RepID=A0ABP8VU98_9MICO